jgi:hypothetical protein
LKSFSKLQRALRALQALGLFLVLQAACIDTADLGTIPDASSEVPILDPDGGSGGPKDGGLDELPQPKITDCVTNHDCKKAGEYCKKAPGQCDVRGTCSLMPKACAPGGAGVCDCNGSPQTSECEAAEMGLNLRSALPCLPGPQVEGGPVDAPPSIDP